MKTILQSRVFTYCVLAIALNIFGLLAAKFGSLGYKPYPPLIGIIVLPIMYSLFYCFLIRRIVKYASIVIVIAPSFFYLVLMLINDFASWDLILIINELMNYPLYLIGSIAKMKGYFSILWNDIFFYIICPILYQLLLLFLVRKLISSSEKDKVMDH